VLPSFATTTAKGFPGVILFASKNLPRLSTAACASSLAASFSVVDFELPILRDKIKIKARI
jgi:hypothetical protein